jgi:hypothetical protein
MPEAFNVGVERLLNADVSDWLLTDVCTRVSALRLLRRERAWLAVSGSHGFDDRPANPVRVLRRPCQRGEG